MMTAMWTIVVRSHYWTHGLAGSRGVAGRQSRLARCLIPAIVRATYPPPVRYATTQPLPARNAISLLRASSK